MNNIIKTYAESDGKISKESYPVCPVCNKIISCENKVYDENIDSMRDWIDCENCPYEDGNGHKDRCPNNSNKYHSDLKMCHCTEFDLMKTVVELRQLNNELQEQVIEAHQILKGHEYVKR